MLQLLSEHFFFFASGYLVFVNSKRLQDLERELTENERMQRDVLTRLADEREMVTQQREEEMLKQAAWPQYVKDFIALKEAQCNGQAEANGEEWDGGTDGGERAEYGVELPEDGGELPEFGGERAEYDGERAEYDGELPEYGAKRAEYGGELPEYGGEEPEAME